VPRTIAAIALEVSSGLRLSNRQFEVLCEILRASGDPEEKARELNATPRGELLEVIGERKL
jgi:hypothetical protein